MNALSAESMNRETRVRVYLDSNNITHGVLSYSHGEPVIVLDDGELVNRTKDIVDFSFEKPTWNLKEKDIVCLHPHLIRLINFSQQTISTDNMYPPSTDGWLRHIGQIGLPVTAFVHQLRNRERHLISFVKNDTSEIIGTFVVRPYELGFLLFNTEFQEYTRMLETTPFKQEQVYSKYRELLDGPPPKWEELGRLVENVNIPGLKLRQTMRDTIDVLISSSFPESVREELLTFLAWTTQVTLPTEDPIDFFEGLESTRIFRDLVCGHLQCLLDDIEPPPYVQILTSAAQGRLDWPKRAARPVLDQDAANPWNLTWQRLIELFPNWLGTAIEYAEEMNAKGIVTTSLPVSRASAATSRKAWRDRLAVYFQGLMMRGDVKYPSLGLNSLVYIGAAHRWPHKFLSWSAQLSADPQRPKFIQVMIAPPQAADRIARAMPAIYRIIWATRQVNLSLYDRTKQSWKFSETRLLKSVLGNRSLAQIQNEFGSWKNLHAQALTREEAKVLDIVSWGAYLSTLESGKISHHYGIDSHTIESSIKQLVERGILAIQYIPIPKDLISILVVAEGSEHKIHSLARAFIKHTPSATVMSSNEKNTVIIFCRLPEGSIASVANSLPAVAAQNDVSVSFMPLFAFVGYRHNLYQRLLKKDGTWDEDPSMMLSQIRLPSSDD